MEGKRNNWAAAVVALGFIALTGLIFWVAAHSTDFATIWAAVGSLIGVVVGAIPSFFFKTQADGFKAQADDSKVALDKTQAKADDLVKQLVEAKDRATIMSEREFLFRNEVGQQTADKIRNENPRLFA